MACGHWVSLETIPISGGIAEKLVNDAAPATEVGTSGPPDAINGSAAAGDTAGGVENEDPGPAAETAPG